MSCASVESIIKLTWNGTLIGRAIHPSPPDLSSIFLFISLICFISLPYYQHTNYAHLVLLQNVRLLSVVWVALGHPSSLLSTQFVFIIVIIVESLRYLHTYATQAIRYFGIYMCSRKRWRIYVMRVSWANYIIGVKRNIDRQGHSPFATWSLYHLYYCYFFEPSFCLMFLLALSLRLRTAPSFPPLIDPVLCQTFLTPQPNQCLFIYIYIYIYIYYYWILPEPSSFHPRSFWQPGILQTKA